MEFPSLMVKRLTLIAALLVPAVLPTHSMATPWIPVGDMRAKHSVQLLADRGCLSAPTGTWPMMWADISPSLDNATNQCRSTSAWKYLTFERNLQRDSNARLSVKAQHATREPLFRSFSDAPRSTGEITLSVDMHYGNMAFGITPTYVHNPIDGDEARLDGSYLAGKLGNWVLGAGQVDRWWGPGWHSSTILSNNARPVPGVWINRAASRPSQWRPFSWLGPWNVVAFAGQLENDRHISHAKLIGARFSFKPAPFIELGASRTLQWGGDGRSTSLSSLGNAIIGRDNGQRGPGKDPSNQLAGFDIRLSAPVGQQTVAFYMQMIGEDEAGGMPAKYMQHAGVDMASQYGTGEQRFYLEVADTQAGSWFSYNSPNVAYEHSTWRSGYRYQGRNLASTWESDARVFTLGAAQYFANGNDLSFTYSYARLNYTGTTRNRPTDVSGPLLAIPGKEQKVNLATLAYAFNLLEGKAGRLTLAGQFTDKKINVIKRDHSGQRSWPRAIGMASWEYRFD